MGFLSGLFGVKEKEQPSPSIPEIVLSIDRSGGQAIVAIPFQNFADYMNRNGEVRSVYSDGFEGFITLQGKKRKVVFSYGPLNNLESNETLVRVFSDSGIEENLDNINIDSLGEALASVLDEYVQGTSSIEGLTYQIISMAIMEYNHIAIGQDRNTLQEDDYPNYVTTFLSKVQIQDEGDYYPRLRDEFECNDIDFRQFNSVFKSLTRDISDPDVHLQVNFAIAHSIITKYKLI
jgi:hypothetical protein